MKKIVGVILLATALSSCGSDDNNIENCTNVGSSKFIDIPLHTVIKNNIDFSSEIIKTTKLLREKTGTSIKEDVSITKELYDNDFLIELLSSEKIINKKISTLNKNYFNELALETIENSFNRHDGNVNITESYIFVPEKLARHEEYCKGDFISDVYTVKKESSIAVDNGEPFVENFEYQESFESEIISINQSIIINNKEYTSIRESVTFFNDQGHFTKREERWIDVPTGENLRVDSYHENEDIPYNSVILDSIE